jgi:hypothetical protein
VLGFSLSTIMTASSALAALVLLLVFLDGRKPRRAEKWEKAAIMRKLLAASDREEAMKRMKEGSQARKATPQPTMRQAPPSKSKLLKPQPPTPKPVPKVNIAAAGKAR